jgi:hypothetical protein
MSKHVVVDGSNIATEGRTMPSLAQLHEAVMAFMTEYPDALITVVVDATFGHRIDPRESKEFDEAVANNEVVAPPAGAVGRGDAFVLSIANKVGATVLSNDSFQEFHPQYEWLFDEGRLIGGKPVPHIGWVFVPRVPVRGQVSRIAMKDAKRRRGAPGGGTDRRDSVRTGSPDANRPMPVPKAPPPGARAPGHGRAAAQAEVAAAVAAATTPEVVAPPPGRPSSEQKVATHHVNDVLPFLHFVEHHPVGSSVNAVVESYSSHGAYVRVGDVKAYVPLRLMADPAPRSAREFMKIGDAVTLVVDSFAPGRRSIDLATPAMASAAHSAKAASAPDDKPTTRRSTRRGSAAVAAGEPSDAATDIAQPSADVVAAPTKARRRAAGSVASEDTATVTESVPAARPTRSRKASGGEASAAVAADVAPSAGDASSRRRAAAPRKAAPVAETPAGETPAQGVAPAGKKPTAAKKAPAAKETPAAEKVAAAKKAPVAKKAPAAKEVPAVEKAPVAKKPSAAKKAPAAKKVPAVEKVAPSKKAPAAEKAPVAKKPSAAKKAPAAEGAPAAKKAPAKKATSVAEPEPTAPRATAGRRSRRSD